MDHVSTFAVSTSDAVSEVHCRGTERACRCGATEGFARERRPVGAADQDEGPCRSGGSGSPARVGQVVATPGLRRGTGRAGPRYHALRIARRARRGGGRGGPPLVHRQAADPARLHVKKSLVATERRRARARQQRADWFRHRLPAIAASHDRVVFPDETAVKTNLTRLRGRTLRGERLTMDAPFGSRGTQTLIAG